MIDKIVFYGRGANGLPSVEEAVGFLVSVKDGESVLDELASAGFAPAHSRGGRRRFVRGGRTFEEESAFLSDGEFCLTLKEADV